jgi:hypothetical protein
MVPRVTIPLERMPALPGVVVVIAEWAKGMLVSVVMPIFPEPSGVPLNPAETERAVCPRPRGLRRPDGLLLRFAFAILF